jgi:SOS-response transcriptional repressor LexA
MIPFEEIDKRLSGLDKSRVWLAEVTPYSADYLRTVLAPNSTRRTPRVQQIITDAIEKEEARQREAFSAPPKPAVVLPDRVTIECQPDERRKWDAAARTQKQAMDDWIVSSLNHCADLHLLLPKSEPRIQQLESARPMRPPLRFELPCLGALAAGSGNFGDDLETVMVSKEYPKGCFALRVLGDSMDSGGPDAIPDGSICIFKPMPQGAYAAKGKIYAFATPDGDVIKQFSRKNGGELVSLNPTHPPIPYNQDMKACGEFIAVETAL